MGPNRLRRNYYSDIDHVLLIAHRGACSYRPEHTIESYTLAAEMGCDLIEPDLVMTKDGYLVVRHENNITDTTNVKDVEEFFGRRCRKVVDGEEHFGWFSEDFTLEELQTLKCRERLQNIRKESSGYDDLFKICTFEEVIQLAQSLSKRFGRTIGVYPETKHPTYFRNLGLPIEEKMLKTLELFGWGGGDSPVIIQSFEVGNLKMLRKMTDIHLVQLINSGDKSPEDWREGGKTYADMITKEGLFEVSKYADSIGIVKDLIIPRNIENNLTEPSEIINYCRQFGLMTTVWTLRPENHFLPSGSRIGNDDSVIGNAEEEIQSRAYHQY